MQPEGLIADDQAVVVAVGGCEASDGIYHIIPTALTQGQGPADVKDAAKH